MGFQYLPDIHTGRDAEGVQHNLHRAAVFHVRHILLRQYPGDDTLVAVPARHLVPHLKLTFNGNVNLHHLDHAGREVVPALQFLDFILKNFFNEVNLLIEPVQYLGDFFLDSLAIGKGYLVPAVH